MDFKPTGSADVDNYLRQLADAKLSPGTIRQYREILKGPIAHTRKEPKNITISDLEEYNTVLSKRLTQNIQKTHLIIIKKFFAYRGYISKQELDTKLPLPKTVRKLPEYLTMEEAYKLLEAAKYNPRNHGIITTFLYSGLRLSELTNLDIEDINFQENAIKVRAGKGNKDRLVPLAAQVRDAISEYLGYRINNKLMPKEGDALFLGQKGMRISPEMIAKMLRMYSAKAGIRHVHPHLLRHTALTMIYRKTRDIYFTSKIAGHTTMNMTQLYAHVDTDYLKEVYQKANIDYGGIPPMPEPIYKKPERKEEILGYQ